jgi:hypothetical protein
MKITLEMNRTTLLKSALVGLPVVIGMALLGVTLKRRALMEPFFVHGTYFALTAMVLFWGAAYAQACKGLDKERLRGWLKDNWRGLVLTALVLLISLVSIEPGLRVLADETNLLGTSKNFHFNKTADFSTTGKWYYEAYWSLNTTIDRRPTLYPYLVSLIHGVRGYHYSNAFWANALLIPFFVFTAYRLAKSLGGEIFGLLAGALVMAHPISLISARSGGFDLMAATFSLLIVKHLLDYCQAPSANRLALLWMNLVLLAHIRYEGSGFLIFAVVVLLAFRMVRFEYLKTYAFLYAFSPLFLLPRVWQMILKANDWEQPLSATLFGRKYVLENLHDYFAVALKPFSFQRPHAGLIIILGGVGLIFIARALWKLIGERKEKPMMLGFAALVTVWTGILAAMLFTYFWGKPLHPASARLYLPFNAVVSISAAWFLAWLLRRAPMWLVSSMAGLLFLVYVPAAAEARLINELTLARQAAQIWRFLESQHTKNIMVVADRPGLYTVMDYGAEDLSIMKQTRQIPFELSRHLYRDVYVIQEIDLTTKKPTPEFEIWPELAKEPVLEFQNAENNTVRVGRLLLDPNNLPTSAAPPPAPAAPPPSQGPAAVPSTPAR